MNIESINRRILKIENNEKPVDQTLENNLVKQALSAGKTRQLSPQGKADILTMKITPNPEQYLSHDRIEHLKKLEQKISNDELLRIPSNKEYFFMSELRERKLYKEFDIISLSKNYNINKEELLTLKENHYLDWLSPEELESKLKNSKESLIQRGFLSSLTHDEATFLKEIENKELTLESANLISSENFKDISSGRLKQIQFNKHLNILNSNEFNFLSSGASPMNLQKFSLSKNDYYRLKKRITFNEENKIVEIDLKVQVNLSDILFATAKVHYREHKPILELRPHLPLLYNIETKGTDTSIYLRGIAGEKISKRELERFYELKSHQFSPHGNFVPNNTDLLFLKKIDGRKLDYELVQKIGINDFSLPKERIFFLIENEYISFKNGYSNNAWIEPKMINEARIWNNTHFNYEIEKAQHILTILKIHEPGLLYKNLLINQTPSEVKNKLEDYELFLRVNLKEPLGYTESQRLEMLRENGIHPELETRFIHDEPNSWNMKLARKKSFNDLFLKRYSVNTEALEFVNKFKQVTHQQLIKMGLTDAEIERYVRGIINDKIPFGGKLLNVHSLATPAGGITYYSIQHHGLVSGRSLLEQKITKELIASKPQQRTDLLFHDLKVVDCVLEMKNELESKGYKIKEIKNESSQYSDSKSGIKNEWRKGGPSFMDAVLIVEEPQNLALGISGGTKTIAVEYGNYTNDRMISKIENSEFDQAIVFSSASFQQKYSKMEITKDISFRCM